MKRSVMVANVLVWIGLLLLPSAMALMDVKNQPEILQAYQKKAQSARNFKGTVFLQIQQLYCGQVESHSPKLFEQMYFVLAEDPIFQSANHLFFKSFAFMEWKMAIERGQMNGTRKIVNANTDFYPANPIVPNVSNEILKSVRISEGLEYPLSITPPKENGTDAKPNDIFFPTELMPWHSLPELWYPNLEVLGFPRDLKNVTAKGENPLAAFIYSPERMPSSLLHYFRQCSQNPNLALDDLLITFVVNTASHMCNSLVISVPSGEQRQILFNIANSGETPSLMGFNLPTNTVFYTCAANQSNGQTVWGTHYFTQFSLKGFERNK